MNFEVSLAKCTSYNDKEVEAALRKAISAVTDLDYIRKGTRVVIKPNLVSFLSPDRAATSHPVVLNALIRILNERGADITVGDSPGGLFNSVYVNRVYKATGMNNIEGAALNRNFSQSVHHSDSALRAKEFAYTSYLDDADVIINLCKLKTHGMMGMSNAVKNMFGAIPGLTKVEMHGQFKTLDVFGDFLYDILAYFKNKLVLNVCDAIIAMEGAGPSNGTPKKVGAVLASSNATALDAVSVGLMGLNAKEMPTIQTGISRNFVDKDLNIEVLGETVASLVVKDFDTVQPNNFKPFADSVPRWLQKPLHRLTTRRPAVNRRKCKGCKKCFEHCPVQAITMTPTKKGGIPKAKFDYNKCIRCFCCQELCPFGLVKVKTGLIYKIIHIGSNKKKSN